MGSWFVVKVLPVWAGNLPYLVIGAGGLWLTVRGQRKSADRRHRALHDHLPGTCPFCSPPPEDRS